MALPLSSNGAAPCGLGPASGGPIELLRRAGAVARFRAIKPGNLLLAQALTLSGLIGASGAYASLVRRRQERRVELAEIAASQSRATRVETALFLGRIDDTFIRSA